VEPAVDMDVDNRERAVDTFFLDERYIRGGRISDTTRSGR
jgi:hypothetical protein